MNNHQVAVAKSVRAELRACDLSQARIGEVLGLDQTSVSRRMRGTIPWRADEIAQMSAAFGIPVERFYARVELLEAS